MPENERGRTMPSVVFHEAEELSAQRQQLLDEVRMDYQTLRDKAAAYQLTRKELSAW